MSQQSRPSAFEDRYRLYLDESGDHVYRATTEMQHRFLGLLGCWFNNADYLQFHEALEDLKRRHFHHHPDNPVIFHREDIINRRKVFKVLQDDRKRAEFDSDLLGTIEAAKFKVVVVVIDKKEDSLLMDSYTRVYEHGAWGVTPGEFFQLALTSRQLKLRGKKANIAGLQLADLIAHPAKLWVLRHYGLFEDAPAPFAERLMNVVENKFNRQLYDNRVEGYGFVLYPKK